MRISALKYTVLSWVSILIILIFVIVPFQGFLPTWGSSLFGHYTFLRLWDEILLIICLIGSLYLLLTDKKIRFNTLSRRLVQVILAYIFLSLALGIISYTDNYVTKKALFYGLIVNLRFLVFFLVTWCVALRISRLKKHWQTYILWPAAVVVLFGLLQLIVLPHDFLKHFGYGPSTIPVMETVNSNSKYIRIPSTLRGANPLGAYLIIPISILLVLLLKFKRTSRQILLLIGGVITLFFTYSRSAVAGTFVSALIILFNVNLPKKVINTVSVLLILVLIVGGLFYALDKNNSSLQNVLFHTQTNSKIKSTSDANHISSLSAGIKQVEHEPLGLGPGTAGPASVYNNNKTRIAENYFVQIGQEVGWLGLILFILINIGVGYLLWVKRSDPLALALLASLVGITIVNMFSHAWSDDTLSYIWWGLAGIAMVPDKIINKEDDQKTVNK